MSHPLFPLEGNEAEDQRDIAWIHVSRYENGSWEFAPAMLPAHELEDLTRISDEYGGGRYELVGRSTDRRRITARAKYNIPGPPKPLVPVTATAAAAPVSPAPAHVDPLALVMAQQGQMMQLMMQQQQQQTQVLVAALQGKQQDVSPMVAAVAQMAMQQGQQAAAMMAQARALPQGQAMGADEVRKWMEIGAKLKGESSGGEDWLETIGVVLAGIMQGQQAAQAGQAGGPPAGQSPAQGGSS